MEQDIKKEAAITTKKLIEMFTSIAEKCNGMDVEMKATIEGVEAKLDVKTMSIGTKIMMSTIVIQAIKMWGVMLAIMFLKEDNPKGNVIITVKKDGPSGEVLVTNTFDCMTAEEKVKNTDQMKQILIKEGDIAFLAERLDDVEFVKSILHTKYPSEIPDDIQFVLNNLDS